MSFPVPGRKAAALAAATAGLTALLSGAISPVAYAVPDDSDWFTDVRTPDERNAAVVVPKRPKAYGGKWAETQALYRTRAGDLAVPVERAFGHVLEEGQAVTIDRQHLFDHTSLTQLAAALQDASSIRCEGYADYVGKPSRRQVSAQRQPVRVCDFLVAANDGIEATSVGYGMNRPAVVADRARDRRVNRRVVVQVTSTHAAYSAPSAPNGLTASVAGDAATITFLAPSSDGGMPITGYQISSDGGQTWDDASVDVGSSQLHTASLVNLVFGHVYDVRLRAVNDVGTGIASDSVAVAPVTLPSAPASLTATMDGLSVTLAFEAPTFDGGSTVTGYEVKIDDGWWVPAGDDLTETLTGQTAGTHVYWVRAVNSVGHSAGVASNIVELGQRAPEVYGSFSNLSGVEVSTMVYFRKYNAETTFEARLDDGQWLPLSVSTDGGHWASGSVTHAACESGCRPDHTIAVRAVTTGGRGLPSEPYAITFPPGG